MTNSSTILLVPFILAFLLFTLRFYGRERASSLVSASFLLAIGTMLIAGSYLVLGVTGTLPEYSTIGFAAAGLVLLVLAILRMYMI